jgi:hypothetical protein
MSQRFLAGRVAVVTGLEGYRVGQIWSRSGGIERDVPASSTRDVAPGPGPEDEVGMSLPGGSSFP